MKTATSIKIYLIIALLALCTVLIIQNTDIVEIRLLLWRLSISRVLLLLGTTAIGFVLGVLTTMEIIRRNSNRK